LQNGTQEYRYAYQYLSRPALCLASPAQASQFHPLLLYLTLALGIGINTSLFTLLYSVAFRPLAVKNPESVVNVYQTLEGEFDRQVEAAWNCFLIRIRQLSR